MGGGKAGSSSYENYVLDWHSWVLMGVDAGKESNFNADAPLGGLIAATNDVLSTTLGSTPYALVNVFDPKNSISRFGVLMDEVDNYLVEVKEAVQDDRFSQLSTLRIPSTSLHAARLTAINDSGKELGYRLNLEAADEIAQINARASAGNSTGHSTRIIAVGKVIRKVTHQVGDFYQEAVIENYNEFRDTLEGSLQLMDISNRHNSARAVAIGALTASVDLWSAAIRQRTEDDLKLAVEDLIWDLKLWDFAGKALSSIGGAAIIPAGSGGENRTLESISTFATTGASIASAT